MPESLNIDWLVSDKIGILNGLNPVESPEILEQLEHEGYTQVVTVRPWLFTMAWRLPNYNLRNFMVRVVNPSDISRWDLFRLNEFCVYELMHGRKVMVWFEDARVQEIVVASISRFFAPGKANLDEFLVQAMATQRDRLARFQPEPPKPTGCQYCHEGICVGDPVCHTTTIESASNIIQSGRILSTCGVRGISGKEMVQTLGEHNVAGDPPDYFEYVMFGSGNCTAVDKLVLERIVGHVPSWEEFETTFQPGVRFYFRTDDLHNHPGFTLDGIHGKIHNELALDPWLVVVVIPEGLAGSDELIELARRQLPPDKVASYPFKGMHFKDWAHMVYRDARLRGEA